MEIEMMGHNWGRIFRTGLRLASVAVVGGLGLAGCSGQEVAEFKATTCQELAREFASELEARTFAAIEDDDRDPFYIAEDVDEIILVVARGLDAVEDKEQLGCTGHVEFHDDVVAALSDRFKSEVPSWLSSIDIGNTWEEYDQILNGMIEGAFLPQDE